MGDARRGKPRRSDHETRRKSSHTDDYDSCRQQALGDGGWELSASTIIRSTNICGHFSTRVNIHDSGRTPSVLARPCITDMTN